MKASKYNMFYTYNKDSNKKIIYNSRTGATSVIDNNLIDAELNNISSHIIEDSSNEQFRNQLYENEFLIDSEFDETSQMNYRYLTTKFSNNSLSLTIAPTMDCNFNCAYCYEKSVLTKRYMSQDIQDKIIDFIECRKSQISELNITWYGGEPLLAFSIIKNLTERIIKICSDNNILYHASMITNGYLLSSRIITELNKLCVKSIQITIDGMEDTHNQRRPLINSDRGTFQTIISNLVNNKNIIPETVVVSSFMCNLL